MAFFQTAMLFVVQLFCAMDRDDVPLDVMTPQEFLQRTDPVITH